MYKQFESSTEKTTNKSNQSESEQDGILSEDP